MKRLLLLYFVFVVIANAHCRGGGRGGGGRGGGRGGGGIFGSIWGKSSSRHTYPGSNGYSGFGPGGSHGYPSSNGLSGLIKQPGFRYGQRFGSYRFSVPRLPRVPSYYTVPQYVYVNQYRQSSSRFNNLLIGLTMYNMGRSHVGYHHYYHDSYYRRNNSASKNADHAVTSTSAEEKANEDKDDATCLMRVREDEKEEVLKIPCAIVTTFADGTRKLPYASDTTTVVCVNSSVANLTSEEHVDTDDNVNTTEANTVAPNKMICKSTIKSVDPLSVTGSPLNATSMNCTVEIWTREEVISNEVDCEILLKYAKMPVPQNKDAIIMPPRSELKEMLEHPPWWSALFFAI
ncbi:eukaryotic translation initiation factor 3 subunit D-like [Leguminivora glycinivorella]|uniref:eukaryotic translation initiation factor 3 subunit D-like n=1 Tax=Leguminivora glycinivorella TaxID=1035111 RepID=UPI00200EE3CB|nr:eukaryotic translation initiation factor 3 subunit D-like [Leguminivora glycinivorella]